MASVHAPARKTLKLRPALASTGLLIPLVRGGGVIGPGLAPLCYLQGLHSVSEVRWLTERSLRAVRSSRHGPNRG